MTLYMFHRHTACLVDRVDFIRGFYSWWEGLGSSSLATLPVYFSCGFISPSTRGSFVHWGLLLRLPWRTRVCPCEGQAWRRCSCLGRRGSGSPRYPGGWRLGQQEYSALEACGSQHWPRRSSALAWRIPLPDSEAHLQGRKESDRAKATLHA